MQPSKVNALPPSNSTSKPLRKVLHVNLHKEKGTWYVKKSFNILIEIGKIFSSDELEQWIKDHPNVRVVCRYV